ncbi:hypothetical protein Tsubulata_028649 [Turnera subulata]|uniref:J domain-containing protein n=1 Tax=Turnera subulata TaxID=218843 RepID=A0A9Q0FG74_9ROSI|nr:hypothetical protein Tsubulata_028649 [Turnera subulata]
MATSIDHYRVLGLHSGEEGAKLMEREITRGYKLKALELHPDKRPGDPNAHADFKKLKSLYDTLLDPAARKRLDDSLREKRVEEMVKSIVDPWAHDVFKTVVEPFTKNLRDRLKHGLDDLYSRNVEAAKRWKQEAEAAEKKKETQRPQGKKKESPLRRAGKKKKKETPASSSTSEKTLQVLWEKGMQEYSALQLINFFRKFGEVKSISLNESCKEKNRKSATVVIVAADSVVVHASTEGSELSNPIRVV